MSDDWDELDYDDGWGFDNSTSYEPNYWSSSVGKAVFTGIFIIVITIINTWVVTKASKDEEPSSFVRLVKILGITCLCSVPVWFFGIFLINVSMEYQSTAYPFIVCYGLGPMQSFVSLLITATVILAGVDRVLVSWKSIFDACRLYLVVVPLISIVSVLHFFSYKPEAVGEKLYSGDTQQRYILDYAGYPFASDFIHYLYYLIIPISTIVFLAVLIAWVWSTKRDKNEYTDNGSSGCWEEKVFIAMALIKIAPSIHHIVGAFIIFLPFEVEVYLYLGFSLTQSVVAVPYLVWG